jgi:tRNA U34 5-methylaminomethyl-2-thiouridine-forming methyltransferase MnmC
MDRALRLTEDGTHTLYVGELDETYHSNRGAMQESMHVFINQGFHKVRKTPMRILEIGLGTGLNLLLTLVESLRYEMDVYYYAVEKYPLAPSEYSQLNFEKFIPGIPKGSLIKIHEALWEEDFSMTENFLIHKEQSDFRSMNPTEGFDLVYFDAFAPDKQPHLWSTLIFSQLYDLISPGGILVSYTSKGIVRRALNSCGFEVKKLPGPLGKWEMIRATRR